jgi:hypothetical protein
LSIKLIAAIIAAGLLIGVFGFGRHLNLHYTSLIASTQNAKPLLDMQVIEGFSTRFVDELNERNIELAIVSRAGQPRDRLPVGVSYTHSAFWVSNDVGGYDVYNLYHGEENRLISSLIKDLPIDFLTPTRAKDFGVILPTPAFQKIMKAHILSDDYGRAHNPNYSLISNPFDTGFQNCNEFLLDELASVVWREVDKTKLKVGIKKQLKPTEIKAGFIRRHVAPYVDERLVMSDHGKQIFTTTRLDLLEFLKSQNVFDQDFILDFNEAE